MTNIGIFGGAFNPIHNGHVQLAKQICDSLSLKKLLVIPTATSPHKEQAGVSFEDRAEMCRLAFEGCKRIEVSNIENRLGGKNYTILTLRALRELYPKDTQFFTVIGADMLFSFTKWYRYESILKESKVVAVARHEGEYPDMLECAREVGRVKVLNLPVCDVSSTEVRAALANGGECDMIPASVLEYIKAKELYR